MSDEALRDILAIPGGRGVLTTLKRDGRPQLSVVFHRWDADASTLSISVTTLAMAVALLVVGPVTERVGRTPIIRASVVVTGEFPEINFSPRYGTARLPGDASRAGRYAAVR